MSNVIDNLKFDIIDNAPNAATQLLNNGFLPSGEAKKNGWEEIRDMTDNIKIAITGLYTSVMEIAGDIRRLGGHNNKQLLDIYVSLPQDVEITANTLIKVDGSFKDKKGFFRNPDEAAFAQQIVLDYYNVFEKVKALTTPMLIELQDILISMKNHQENLTNPSVISDVEIKA